MPEEKSASNDDATLAEESFEQSLARLESIVEEMEDGEMPLDQLVQQYEHGVKLVKKCTATLKAAEERVKVLSADDDGSLQTEELADHVDQEPTESTPKKS